MFGLLCPVPAGCLLLDRGDKAVQGFSDLCMYVCWGLNRGSGDVAQQDPLRQLSVVVCVVHVPEHYHLWQAFGPDQGLRITESRCRHFMLQGASKHRSFSLSTSPLLKSAYCGAASRVVVATG
jgi:hypothetical protein